MHLELDSNSLTLVSRPYLIWPQPPSPLILSHSISWVTWASLQLLNYTQFLSASQCPCICSSAWNVLPPHHITSFSFSSRTQLRSWQLSEALPDYLHLPLCFALPCFTPFVSVIPSETHVLFVWTSIICLCSTIASLPSAVPGRFVE